MEKLKIRKDRTPAMLRKLAKAESDVRVARRLLAIANALCGMSRAAAAESAGLSRRRSRVQVPSLAPLFQSLSASLARGRILLGRRPDTFVGLLFPQLAPADPARFIDVPY